MLNEEKVIETLQAAYVELLTLDSNQWPNRATMDGQALLSKLRGVLAELAHTDIQDVQETCEGLALYKMQFKRDTALPVQHSRGRSKLFKS